LIVYGIQRHFQQYLNNIVVVSCVVDYGFETRSGQTKEYKIGICCFSAKNIELRKDSKYWLARNQHIMSECADLSICRLFREATNTNFIFFCLTRSGLEPIIYHTRGMHANHYTTNVVQWVGGFLPVLQFPPAIKLTTTILFKYC
jgi:hypothetical protein